MSDFYLKARYNFFPIGMCNSVFEQGRFYEVAFATESLVSVLVDGRVANFSTKYQDYFFERIDGSFVDLVANRPVLNLVAHKIWQILWNCGVPGSIIRTIEDELKRFFKNERHPQPDTPLTGWEFTIIERGQPKHFLSEVLSQSPVTLPDVTVSIKFESDDVFVYAATYAKTDTMRVSLQDSRPVR